MNECPRRFGLVRRAQRCRRVFIHKFPCIATPDPCRRPRTGSRGHVLTRTPAKVPAVPAPCPPLQPGRVARAGLGVGGIQFASSEMREQDVVLPPDVVRGLRNPSGTRRIDTLSVGIGSLSGPDETADRSPTQRSNNTTPPRSGRLQIRMADIKWDSLANLPRNTQLRHKQSPDRPEGGAVRMQGVSAGDPGCSVIRAADIRSGGAKNTLRQRKNRLAMNREGNILPPSMLSGWCAADVGWIATL